MIKYEWIWNYYLQVTEGGKAEKGLYSYRFHFWQGLQNIEKGEHWIGLHGHSLQYIHMHHQEVLLCVS